MPYKDLEKRRQCKRDYYHRNKDRFKAYRQTKKGKDVSHTSYVKHRATHKKDYRCRRKMSSLIDMGYIQRDVCAICGKENAETHHPTYNLPYCIIWLCKKHHAWVHRKCNKGVKE